MVGIYRIYIYISCSQKGRQSSQSLDCDAGAIVEGKKGSGITSRSVRVGGSRRSVICIFVKEQAT